MRVPAALLAVPLLAGAGAGVIFFEPSPDRLTLVTAFAAVLCALAGIAFFADEAVDGVVVCVCAGAALAGYSMSASTMMALVAPPLLQWFESVAGENADPVMLEGRLREDAALLSYGAVLTLDVRRLALAGAPAERTDGGVRLVVGGTPVPADVAAWRAGRSLRVWALLRRPASFSNPGVGDETRQLALRGVALTGSIKSAALVDVISRGNWLEERAASVRARTRRVIGEYVGRYDPRSAAVATAILIGDRTGLSIEDERRLQDAGTYHVIAISGGNIAILTALLVLSARAVRIPYRTGAATCIAILLFYGQVAGGSPSVARAITAAAVFLTALILDHRGAPLNVLGVAALLAVAVRPVTTVDGGFLLSFGATAGIILGVPRLVRWAPAKGDRLPRRIVRGGVAAATGLVTATVCAETALAPIAASLFSRVTFAGLVLNFVAIPLMTAVQCGSMALLACAAAWPAAAGSAGRLVHWSAWALVESSSFVEWAPWLARDVPPPAWWVCVLYYAAAILLLVVPRYRRLFGVSLLVMGAVIVSGAGPSADGIGRQPSGVLRVVVLDVGQGDATVAVLPDGRAILVDAGGLAGTSFEIGARVVVPSLRALGVRTLHALVLTHGDPDHVDGAEEVLRRLPVANVWEGVPVPPHPTLRRLSELAGSRRIVWRTVRPGDVERAGGVELRVHHPPEPDWERQRVRNDDSVVLELRYGAVSILLPGDIGREVEHTLVPQLSLAPLVVLKAPHHGSATSSSEELLDATDPQVVIFSAGRNNRFGHPAKLVVERYARRGVEMFNTATDGAVFVETDGKSIEMHGWRTKHRVSIHGGLRRR